MALEANRNCKYSTWFLTHMFVQFNRAVSLLLEHLSCVQMDPIFFCEKQSLCFILLHASPKYRSFGSSLDNYVKSSKKRTYGFNNILRLTKNMNTLFNHKSLKFILKEIHLPKSKCEVHVKHKNTKNSLQPPTLHHLLILNCLMRITCRCICNKLEKDFNIAAWQQ